MRTILFSPVGSTDPIAGQRDGALLHVTRVYRPDKVYLYMSKEMCELETKDSRYTYCLNELKVKIGQDFGIELIKRPELVEVHIFDTFLNEFQQIINDIMEREGECHLLLNVSSGTPAMKSALQLLAAMAERKVTPIQVASPNKAYNERREDVKGEYSVELQWELNEDNGEEFENRCNVSSNINMAARIKKEIIKKHIRAYDYVAAARVAESMRDFIEERAASLIKAGAARMHMDKAECSRLLARDTYELFPYKGSEECKIFEYLVIEYIKLQREEYMEFIRGITPLFFNVIIRILRECTCFDLERVTFTKRDDEKRGIYTRYWKSEASEDPELKKLGILVNGGQFIQNVHLLKLLDENMHDKKLMSKIKEMRDIETNLRNPVAHNITNVSLPMIKEFTKTKTKVQGYTPEEIFKIMVGLVEASGIKVKKEYLNTYDALNAEIEKCLRA